MIRRTRLPKGTARERRNSQRPEEYPAARGVSASTQLTNKDEIVVVDTDGGAATMSLPIGKNGQPMEIHNAGTSAHDVTVTPTGTDAVNVTTLVDGAKYRYTYFDGTWL